MGERVEAGQIVSAEEDPAAVGATSRLQSRSSVDLPEPEGPQHGDAPSGDLGVDALERPTALGGHADTLEDEEWGSRRHAGMIAVRPYRMCDIRDTKVAGPHRKDDGRSGPEAMLHGPDGVEGGARLSFLPDVTRRSWSRVRASRPCSTATRPPRPSPPRERGPCPPRRGGLSSPPCPTETSAC